MIRTKHVFTILATLYASLIIGFYLGEDLIGGSYFDYKGLYYLNEKFKYNFIITFFHYDQLGHRQSPVLYIIRSLFVDNETIQRLFFLHLFLLIPIFFYNSLKIIYKDIDKNYLRLLASTILLIPTFRSYSIWTDPHLLGTIFFTLSLYFFLKFKKQKKINANSYYSCISLAISAYISPNFGVFIIFYFYGFFIKFGFSKNLLKIIFLNIFLSLPFFTYLFYFDVNFIFDNKGWDIGNNFYSLENIANKILIISSIYFFNLIPFLNVKKIFKETKILFKFNFFYLLSILFFLICISLFNFEEAYNLTNSGGGFFYNLSNFLFENNYLFYFITAIAFLFISHSIFLDKKNLLLFICLILSNPQITIWQANFSPTIFFLILLLFSSNLIITKFNKKRIFIVYIYFILYSLISIFKNILI